MFVWMYATCVLMPGEDIGSPAAATGGREPPRVSAGNWTRVHSQPLSRLSAPECLLLTAVTGPLFEARGLSCFERSPISHEATWLAVPKDLLLFQTNPKPISFYK